MYAKIIFILIILSSLACIENCNKTSQMKKQKITEINFKPIADPGHLPGRVDSFSALIKISEKFSAAEGSFNFIFILRYNGIEDIVINNPLYYLQYKVQHEGKYLDIDRHAPIPLINSKSGVNTDDFNFDISKIEKDGKEINIKEEVNKPSIPFKTEENIFYSLSIPGFLQDGKLNRFQQGVYNVSFLFSIIEANIISQHPQNLTLQTNPIIINIE